MTAPPTGWNPVSGSCGQLAGTRPFADRPVDNSGGETGLPALHDAARRDLRVELAEDARRPGRHPVDHQILVRQVERPPDPEVVAAAAPYPPRVLLHPLAREVE